MTKRIENFLKNLSIEQLIEARDMASNLIECYDDGYFYICEVRSYGRNWKNEKSNLKSVQDLCYEYNGDDGIVDVYSNNPNLGTLYNYGSTYYIPSREDYEKWKSYSYLERMIPSIEEEWQEWDARESVPFQSRPHFAPIYSKEDLKDYKQKLAEYDMSFSKPISVPYNGENC
jgi:hypothetical protein